MRVFKTKWFARAAKKARITDQELHEAAEEASSGQAVDLGGGVWKKRLNKNMHRGILLARVQDDWFYVYLYAKKDRDNIRLDELTSFKDLAGVYAAMDEGGISRTLDAGELVEIHGEQKA